MLECIFSSLILSGLIVLLWFVLRFTRLNGRNPVVTTLNHLALLAFLLLIWLGIEHLLLLLMVTSDVFRLFATLLPLKLTIGSLVLLFMVQLYSPYNATSIEETLESEPSDEEADPHEKPVRPHAAIDTITVKAGSNIHLIPVNELLFLQAEGDYVLLYTQQTRYIKEETMKRLEAQLPAHFVRIHRSYLVNTNAISRLELYEKQHYLVTLKSGHQLRASISGYRALKEKLQL